MEEKRRLENRLSLERKRQEHVTAATTENERSAVERGSNPWPIWERDARAYIETFAKEFPEATILPDRLRERHEAGEFVVVVDLCGAANARSIGADHTISLILKKWGGIENESDQTIIEGDVLKSGTIEKIIESVAQHGGTVHCVFFRPLGGLGGHGYSMRAHLRLYSALQKIYPHLAQDGEIYLDPSGFQGVSILPEALNAQSPMRLCETEQHIGEGGYKSSRFRIQKREGAPDRLLTIDELRSIPSLERKFRDLLAE